MEGTGEGEAEGGVEEGGEEGACQPRKGRYLGCMLWVNWA
jgi:hypothetical protein